MPDRSLALECKALALILIFFIGTGIDSANADEPTRLPYGPSFDCLQAKTPVEILTCSDPLLMGLDGALGEAVEEAKKTPGSFRPGEHKAWLQRRVEDCNLPVKGGFPSQTAQARATVCLIEMTKKRLAEMGHPVTLAPTALEQNEVHPLCMIARSGLFTEKSPLPIKLADCIAAYAHIPAERLESGVLGAEGAEDGHRTWAGYKALGTMPDGREAIAAYYSGGGSGLFSSIVALTREGTGAETTLTLSPLLSGGDRCNGGIAEAWIKGDRLITDINMTPADTATLLKLTEKDGAAEIPLCAACCFALGREEYPLSTDLANESSKTLSFKVTQAEAPDKDATLAERCLWRSVQDALRDKAEARIEAADFETVAARFRSCMKKP